MDKKSLKFTDYKDQIEEALKKNPRIGINEPVTLLNSFINQPIYDEITGAFVIGGPTIPMIALIGNETGRLYFFALKALIKDFNE